jgi:hypothetical protein
MSNPGNAFKFPHDDTRCVPVLTACKCQHAPTRETVADNYCPYDPVYLACIRGALDVQRDPETVLFRLYMRKLYVPFWFVPRHPFLTLLY